MDVLGDAHAPENQCPLCLSIGARDGPQGLGWHAAMFGHSLGRERLQMLDKCVEALSMSLDILLVVELFVDDDMHHRIEHGDVGAGALLHEDVGMAFERLAARVHNDQRGAPLGRILDESGGDGVVLGWVGADDDDGLSVSGFRERRGDGARADGLHQRCHRTRVAEPRAMVNIVGAKAGAHQLLH